MPGLYFFSVVELVADPDAILGNEVRFNGLGNPHAFRSLIGLNADCILTKGVYGKKLLYLFIRG